MRGEVGGLDAGGAGRGAACTAGCAGCWTGSRRTGGARGAGSCAGGSGGAGASASCASFASFSTRRRSSSVRALAARSFAARSRVFCSFRAVQRESIVSGGRSKKVNKSSCGGAAAKGSKEDELASRPPAGASGDSGAGPSERVAVAAFRRLSRSNLIDRVTNPGVGFASPCGSHRSGRRTFPSNFRTRSFSFSRSLAAFIASLIALLPLAPEPGGRRGGPSRGWAGGTNAGAAGSAIGGSLASSRRKRLRRCRRLE